MIYLYGYLGAGVVLLMFFYIEFRFNKKAQENKALYNLLKPKNQSFGQKIVNNILIPIIAIMITVLFWPAVIIWLIRERYKDYKSEHKEKKKEEPFSVKKEDLIKEYTIDEIEELEMINDPLKAVPDLPFGHLNPVWNEFKEKLKSGSKVWSFTGQWTSEWGWRYQYDGYVITINDVPKDFLITNENSLN